MWGTRKILRALEALNLRVADLGRQLAQTGARIMHSIDDVKAGLDAMAGKLAAQEVYIKSSSEFMASLKTIIASGAADAAKLEAIGNEVDLHNGTLDAHNAEIQAMVPPPAPAPVPEPTPMPPADVPPAQ